MITGFRVRTQPSTALPRGMYAGVVILLLLIPTFYISNWPPSPAEGIWVETSTASSLEAVEPRIVLELKRAGGDIAYRLNGQPVSHAALQEELRSAFSRSSQWKVYIDADPSLTYSDVFDAINVVLRTQGKVDLGTLSTDEGRRPMIPGGGLVKPDKRHVH